MADKKTSSNDTVRILPCPCSHDGQDKMYGAGQRVHNYAKSKPNKEGGWVCTVCGKAKAKQ